MSLFTVDENCVKCGLCAALCPTMAIDFEKGAPPRVPQEKERLCIGCGQCLCFCPESCCRLDIEENRAEIDLSRLPEADAAEVFLLSRRSIRRFQEQPLDENLVTRLLEVTRYAPSASNRQPVRWVLTRDRARTMALGRPVIEAFKAAIKDAPEDPASGHLASVVKAWEEGQDVIFRGAPQLAVALVGKSHPFPEDAAIALTYFELAAQAHGVGCCWGGYFTRAARTSEELRGLVGAGPEEVVVGAQMFGYPRGLHRPAFLPPRKNIDLTWH